jgi:uncharacterized membrane protein HdeD (DUF308 family)
MAQILTHNWPWVALRGLLAVAFGCLALLERGTTAVVPVLAFSGFAIVDGVFMIASAVSDRLDERHGTALLIGGLVAVALGFVAAIPPGISGAALVLLIAAWAIVIAIAEVVASLQLRKDIDHEWLFLSAGLLTLCLGAMLLGTLGVGAPVPRPWIGVYAVAAGLLLVALGLRLRVWGRTHDRALRRLASWIDERRAHVPHVFTAWPTS